MVQDAGHTPVAIVAGDGPSGGSYTPGTLIERYTFDPYGVLLEVTAGTALWGSGGAAMTGSSRIGHQGLFLDRLDADCLQPTMAAGRPGAAPNSSGASGSTGFASGGLAGGPSVGIYHNRNRTYAAHLGRFLQRDPNATGAALLERVAFHATAPASTLADADVSALYAGGLSTYAYVGSNPATAVDPMGLEWYDYVGAGIGPLDTVALGFELGRVAAALIGEYAANMEYDADWALDWSQGDQMYSSSGEWRSIPSIEGEGEEGGQGHAMGGIGRGAVVVGRMAVKGYKTFEKHHIIARYIANWLKKTKTEYLYEIPKELHRGKSLHKGIDGLKKSYHAGLDEVLRKVGVPPMTHPKPGKEWKKFIEQSGGADNARAIVTKIMKKYTDDFCWNHGVPSWSKHIDGAW